MKYDGDKNTTHEDIVYCINNIYDMLVVLIDTGYVTIDKLLNSLVENNIASVENTLIFND